MIKKYLYLVAFATVLAFIVGFSTTALAADFYKGKTLRFIVGYSPGGGYDTYTRAVARHIGKYIPGNPTPVVQNMTGAGSLIAANYTQNRAKRDGLTLGNWNSAFILFEALGDPQVRIKWIGAPVNGGPACGVMGFTGMKTLEDVLNSGKSLKMGATRAGSTLHDLPTILNLTIGTKFDVITGYGGTATIRIAMQRREVEGACFGWESMRVTGRAMLDASGDDKFIPFIIHNRWPDPEVKDLPLTPEVIKAKGGKKSLDIYNTWVGHYDFERPIVAPPGVPKERVEILRKAYKATLKDPQFLAEAKKSRLAVRYVSPEEINRGVEKILGTTSEAKEALQFLVRRKKKKT
jgi:tripartite-type tricarboxylate transporter receptor subunit TctC